MPDMGGMGGMGGDGGFGNIGERAPSHNIRPLSIPTQEQKKKKEIADLSTFRLLKAWWRRRGDA